MIKYKISIVMPVYNTKPEYLERAIDSVLQQTYENFELIIVDDGSEPACAQLCDEIQEKDERIKVIHQENAGVSSARNRGADEAGGEYVMYMDSDDILAGATLREAVDALYATGAQFVFGGIHQIRRYEQFRGTDGLSQPLMQVFEKDQIDFVVKSFFTQRNPDFANVQGIGAVNRGPCARLLQADIAKAIRFEGKLVIGEDVEWNMRVLRACDKVCFVSSIWYGYLVYETSSLNKYYGNRAQLLEDYHILIYDRNREFCEKDPAPYAINMAVSFYKMVGCEYLSEKCPLTGTEKRREIKKILSRDPWLVMFKRGVFSRLPVRYRAFLVLCKMGLGVELLSVWRIAKNAKKK